MNAKVCPNCESRNGLNMMKGEITQEMSVKPRLPRLIEWTCGFCGYKEEDEVICTEGFGFKTITTN